MKTLIIWLSAILVIWKLRATDASVAMVGDGGTCVPSTTITVQLILHGIDTCDVTVNGVVFGTLTYPYIITFTTKPAGGVNDIVVTTGDFLRRTAVNTFHLTSFGRTFNKRKF